MTAWCPDRPSRGFPVLPDISHYILESPNEKQCWRGGSWGLTRLLRYDLSKQGSLPSLTSHQGAHRGGRMRGSRPPCLSQKRTDSAEPCWNRTGFDWFNWGTAASRKAENPWKPWVLGSPLAGGQGSTDCDLPGLRELDFAGAAAA